MKFTKKILSLDQMIKTKLVSYIQSPKTLKPKFESTKKISETRTMIKN